MPWKIEQNPCQLVVLPVDDSIAVRKLLRELSVITNFTPSLAHPWTNILWGALISGCTTFLNEKKFSISRPIVFGGYLARQRSVIEERVDLVYGLDD